MTIAKLIIGSAILTPAALLVWVALRGLFAAPIRDRHEQLPENWK